VEQQIPIFWKKIAALGQPVNGKLPLNAGEKGAKSLIGI
jgi:hypothetical protein